MTNNKQLQNEFEQLPELTHEPDFTIYRDGSLDRVYEAKKAFRSVAGKLAQVAGIMAVESFRMAETYIVEANKAMSEFDSRRSLIQ